MREILFRGKRKDTGEWVEGFYSQITKGATCNPIENDSIITTFEKLDNGEIILTGMYAVIPETVGQFTGLTDKNGKKIFEGDIIDFNHPYDGETLYAVIYNKYGFNLQNFYASCFDYPTIGFSEGTNYMSAIGNIHNKAELLGGDGK